MSSKEAAANMTNKDAARQIIAAADEAKAALLFHQGRPALSIAITPFIA
jgi:hypothetical protein